MKLKSQEMRKLAPELDPLRIGTGWKKEDLDKVQVMVESTYGDSHPGSGHLNVLVEEVRKGIAEEGGFGARYYCTDICDGESQGTDGINYSLASREIIANMIEIHANATPFDAGVYLSSCDKGVPGNLIGLFRVNIPSVFVPGGTMNAGPEMLTLEQLGMYSAKFERGEIDEEKLDWAKCNACPSCGACSFIGTASTMQIMAEALGLTLPGSALMPATSPDLLAFAREAGRQSVRLAQMENMKPSDIVTMDSFENAILVHAAISGSTNCLLHLPAIAHELGIEITGDTFDRLHRNARYLLDVRPAGRWPAECFYYAGGVPAIMEEIKDYLHLDVMTVTGKTLGENLKELKENVILRGELKDRLKGVYDIERLAGKISYGSANARELNSLKASSSKLPEIKQLLENTNSNMLKYLYANLDVLADINALVENAIVDDPPISIAEGGIIKLGYNPEIDKLKTAMTQGKTWLVELEAREREKTGIKGLKVGYNKVFGYFIEVTKSNLSLVPENYIRKQTLTGGERYITEELKELESQVLGAEEKVVSLEYNAFVEIRTKIKEQIERVQKSANIIAMLDVLCSFATVAEDMNYCMPVVDNSGVIEIKDGRHPVIEKMLPSGSFIANDTYMDKDENRLSIITGPNMAGKSTYMRQVALITLMAQIGSFVPASSAHIGIVDKIFTRVGASDDLSMGQSTFMVEMMEVASILKEATNNSLVILDEIGRGTSTYDGLSIAWAVAEYIANKETCGAKTVFATHYHELIDLENKLDGVKNYSIAVKEKGEDVIFLRKIVKGGTDESYGVHVARLAGVPKIVTKRANEILKSIERKNALTNETINKKSESRNVNGQLDMYNYKLAQIAHELDKVNVNELTPIDALNTLVKIKEEMK